ncbi:MAG: hypothetical protein ABIJ97_05735, partial [Bacteroidota bacterium]
MNKTIGNMVIRIIAIYAIFFITSSVHAQLIRYNRCYIPNGNAQSTVHNVFVSDTNYVFYGLSNHINPLNVMSFMTDSNGNLIDSKYFGNTLKYNFCGLEESVAYTNNSTYLVGLQKDYNSSLVVRNFIMYRFSGTDTMYTATPYTYTMSCELYDNILHEDYVYSTGLKAYTINDALHYDVIVMKIDTMGNMIWMNKYGGNRMDIGYKIMNTSDSKLLVASKSSSIVGNAGQWWVLKLDTAGNQVWQRNYGNPLYDDGRPVGLIETSDSCYLITGSYTIEMYGSAEMMKGRILKIDRFGNVVWDKLYGDKTIFTNAAIIKEAGNKDLVGVFNNGLNSGYQTPYNPVVYRLTTKGELKWFRKYYYNDDIYADASVLNSFDFTPDGGYIFAGYGIDNDSVPAQRSWVIKTD